MTKGRDYVLLDDAQVQDVTAVRHYFNVLLESDSSVVLQGSEVISGAVAQMASPGPNRLKLALQSEALLEEMPTQVNATASTEWGLLFFTLRNIRARRGGFLYADWPETILRVQSRRHFRVSAKLDQAWLSWPGQAQRWPLRDVSEEGLGLWLPRNQVLPIDKGSPALLQLDSLQLTLPALTVAYVGPEQSNPARRRVGLQLLGMSGPDVRSLRCWLMAQQANNVTRRKAYV